MTYSESASPNNGICNNDDNEYSTVTTGIHTPQAAATRVKTVSR